VSGPRGEAAQGGAARPDPGAAASGGATRPPARVFLALGSNLGDRERTLQEARRLLATLDGTAMVGVSSLYETAPVGGPEQDDYLNQVVEIATTLDPRDLLDAVHRIEAALGRQRVVRWGPRTLDLDILWYDLTSVAEPDLEVPHPRMEGRRFVLEPLAELAPDLVLPSGRTVAQALERVLDQDVRRFKSLPKNGG
jgi:2-amino-4-hydroxy-6-hydroxymethyldihydropteridine diphosphokinase